MDKQKTGAPGNRTDEARETMELFAERIDASTPCGAEDDAPAAGAEPEAGTPTKEATAKGAAAEGTTGDASTAEGTAAKTPTAESPTAESSTAESSTADIEARETMELFGERIDASTSCGRED